MPFKNRVWSDAEYKRTKAAGELKFKHDQEAIVDLTNQLDGQIKIMQDADRFTAVNAQNAVKDYIGAYKNFVDNRSEAWNEWSKLISTQAPKIYRAEMDKQLAIGRAASNRTSETPKATKVTPTSTASVDDESPLLPSNATKKTTSITAVPSSTESAPAPVTRSDTITTVGNRTQAIASTTLANDSTLSDYERAKAAAGLKNYAQEVGFLQGYALRKANNISVHITQWKTGEEANKPIQFKNPQTGQLETIVPSQVNLDSPPLHWAVVRQYAQDQIIGELLESQHGGVSLRPEYIVDKIDPILMRAEQQDTKLYQDAYTKHHKLKTIQQLDNEFFKLVSGGAGDTEGLMGDNIQSLKTSLFNAYQLDALSNPKGAGAEFKAHLEKWRNKSIAITLRNKGDLNKLRRAWLQGKENYPWAGKEKVNVAKAFPKIFSNYYWNSAVTSATNEWVTEQLQVEKNDANDLSLRYRQAKLAGNDEEAKRLRLEFVDSGYVSLFPKLNTAMLNLDVNIKTGEDAFMYLDERLEANKELTIDDIKYIPPHEVDNFLESRGLTRADVRETATGASTIHKIDKSEEFLKNSINEMSKISGSPLESLSGKINAQNFFRKQLPLEMIELRKQEEFRNMNDTELAEVAAQSILEKIKTDSANYKEGGALTPYVLDSIEGWLYHNQDKKSTTGAWQGLIIEDVQNLNALGYSAAALNIANLRPEVFESDRDGSLNNFWSDLAKATGYKYTPYELALANSVNSKIPLEIEYVEQDMDTLIGLLKANKKFDYVPQPDSKAFNRRLGTINNGKKTSDYLHWTDHIASLWRPESIIRRAQRLEREHIESQFVSTWDIIEISDKHNNSGEHATPEAATNAATYEVRAKGFNLLERNGRVGLSLDYDSTGQLVSFPNNEQATNYVDLRNAFYRKNGNVLSKSVSRDGETMILTENAAKEIDAMDTGGHKYGWKVQLVDGVYQLVYVGPRITPAQKINAGG